MLGRPQWETTPSNQDRMADMLQTHYAAYIDRAAFDAIRVKPKVFAELKRHEESKRTKQELIIRVALLILGAALGVAGTVLAIWLTKP